MGNFKKDLQREQIAHAETKQLVEKLEGIISELKTKEQPERIRYIKVPDLSEVSEEEIKRAYESITK